MTAEPQWSLRCQRICRRKLAWQFAGYRRTRGGTNSRHPSGRTWHAVSSGNEGGTKELMPIGDTPAIQLVIDEALGAGIDHVVIVGSSKPALEQYFAARPDLERMLRAKGNDAMADRLASIGRDWRVSIVPKKTPRVSDTPWDVLPVLLMVTHLSCRSLMRSWWVAIPREDDRCRTTTSGSVVGLMEIDRSKVSAYGVVAPEAGDG